MIKYINIALHQTISDIDLTQQLKGKRIVACQITADYAQFCAKLSIAYEE